MITMDDVLNIACDVMQVNPDEVLVPQTKKGSRKMELMSARYFGMYISRELKLGTFYEIGRFYLRSHCDVIYGIKSLQNELDTNRQKRELKNIIYSRISAFTVEYKSDFMDELLDGE